MPQSRKIILGKPNSLHDTAEGEEDPNFLHIMREIRVEPRKKYEFPVTESQEIGWESRPLLDGNTNSKLKLYFYIFILFY